MGTRLGTAGLIALLASPAVAQQVGGDWVELSRQVGALSSDKFGNCATNLGDVDGDGVIDRAIGSHWADGAAGISTGAVLVYSGATNQVLYRLEGAAVIDRFGCSVAKVGDLDGDGANELLIGSWGFDSPGNTDAGSASLHSGATGALLHQFLGLAAGDQFGRATAGIDDIDNDGVPDLAIGAPLAAPAGQFNAGSVYIYSGATFGLIRQHNGSSWDSFGTSLADAGDVDADGIRDLIIGTLSSSAEVYSGSTGLLLHQFQDSGWLSLFGSTVDGAGDVNRDGHDDLLIGFSNADQGYTQNGAVYVYSGLDGQSIHHLSGMTNNARLGSAVAGAGDIDGDGVPDFLAGAPGVGAPAQWPEWGIGVGIAFSGATGSIIGATQGSDTADRLGATVADAGDIDGDGLSEVLIGSGDYSASLGFRSGGIFVCSLTPFLTLNSSEISISAGAPVQLELQFPVGENSRPYIIMASITGTGPSTTHGLEIPLTLDSVFFSNLSNPALRGTLNSSATGTHQLYLPPTAPTSLVGTTIFLAAASYESSTLIGRKSSIVRRLVVIP